MSDFAKIGNGQLPLLLVSQPIDRRGEGCGALSGSGIEA